MPHIIPGEIMRRIFSFLLNLSAFVLTAATLGGFLGRMDFTLDLLSHFRFHYAVLSFLLFATALLSRRRGIALVMLATLLINISVIRPYLVLGDLALASENRAASRTQRLRVFFANVDMRNQEFPRLVSLAKRIKPDIAVFTEVNARWAEHLAPLDASYPYAIRDPREDKFGMLLLSKLPITSKQIIELPGVAFPSVLFDITLQARQGPLHLIAAHSPAPTNRLGYENRNKMFNRIGELTSDTAALSHPMPTVVVGDLNSTPWSPVFADFLAGAQLQDSRTGRGMFATWSPPFLPLTIPIDHCLFKGNIELRKFSVTGNFGSDHAGVVCDLLLPRSH
jgi:endonuclease/exonuclease/phosphatase (EEP) superfamily protein YafD